MINKAAYDTLKPMTMTSCEAESRRINKRLPGALQQLAIDPATVALAGQGAAEFPFKAPPAFIKRMRRGDPTDPLLRQVLPAIDEDLDQHGFSADPLGEQGQAPVPGLLHKYRGRALLIATGTCAIHCRYCFRRHFPYPDKQDFQPAFDYLTKDTSIHEIILSGGDPLSLPDSKLGGLIEALAAIPHLKRLRIHSRIPVVLPERMTPLLIRRLTHTRLPVVMVIHCNHPNEIDAEVEQVLTAMQRAGITLLNQSVLLRGINDDPEVLAALSERLFAARVLPYYLHLLDPVQGAAHFDVPEPEALRIMHDLGSLLPGYLVPRLVREQAGAPYKLNKQMSGGL